MQYFIIVLNLTQDIKILLYIHEIKAAFNGVQVRRVTTIIRFEKLMYSLRLKKIGLLSDLVAVVMKAVKEMDC